MGGHHPDDRGVQHQPDDADKGHLFDVALGAVLHQHTTEPEKGGGQGGADHQVKRLGHRGRGHEATEICRKAKRDADHQRVGRDRHRHRPQPGDQPATGVFHQLHRGQAQEIAKRRVKRDDGIVGAQRVFAVGALGDRQAQKD